MNDNQELLLADSPPNTPKPLRLPTEEDDLLLDESDHLVSQAYRPFFFPRKIAEEAQETWPSSRYWSKQTTFFLEQSSDQEYEQIMQLGKGTKDSKCELECQRSFPYYGLMKKLELAYQIIQQQQKGKAIALFTSVKHTKSVSQSQNIPQKALKTQRTPKEEIREAEKRNNKWKKYSSMRKSVTEPDENVGFKAKARPKGIKISPFSTNRVINQVDQKQSPLLRGKREAEKQRSKQQFLESMTNWQERRRLKQLQRVQKEQSQRMNGVTFTPTINPKSKLLMKKKGNMLPIYERDAKPKRLGEAITPKGGLKAKK